MAHYGCALTLTSVFCWILSGNYLISFCLFGKRAGKPKQIRCLKFVKLLIVGQILIQVSILICLDGLKIKIRGKILRNKAIAKKKIKVYVAPAPSKLVQKILFFKKL